MRRAQPPTSGAPDPLADPATLAAVQAALACEHAAAWAYGLLSAFVPPARRGAADLVQQGADAHRARRDATEGRLRAVGATPVPAAPAYLPPRPVTDVVSAEGLAVVAESDCAAAWRAVLERTDDAGLRGSALDAMTDATVRDARWRKAAGTVPLVPIFPGQS